MAPTFRKLHPCVAAEVGPVDLKTVHDEATLGRIRAGMDEFAVLVFRDQIWSDAEHLDFAQRLDGRLHTKLGISALQKNRLGNEALGDISNLDESGEIMKSDNRKRMYGLGNRLWHTDASFQDPPGRYSMLSAKVVPPVDADTEFADTRAAYDALPEEEKRRLQSPPRPPLHRLLAPDPRLRVFPGRARRPPGRHPSPRPHHPPLAPPLALCRLARLPDHRLARPRGAAPAPRSDRARDAGGVRLSAQLARGRPRHLGQPRDHASRTALRRHQVSSRAASGDHPG